MKFSLIIFINQLEFSLKCKYKHKLWEILSLSLPLIQWFPLISSTSNKQLVVIDPIHFHLV